MMTHDPHHVAHLAAMILSGRPETPEAHHIKAAVSAARAVMDEADRQAIEADAAAAPAPADEGAEKPAPADEGAEKPESGGKESQ